MLTLLNLLSAVALLVWGTHIVRTGILRVYGASLRRVLSRSMQRMPLAFLSGIAVTALVQSSNATALLVTSFVAQGLVPLTPALAIMLGADVGTALMARVLTFDLSWLSPLLIFLGVVFFLGRKQTRAGQLGRERQSKRAGQETDQVGGPADRNAGAGEQVFQHQAPADEPGDALAEGGI